jgi:hypothetical protein
MKVYRDVAAIRSKERLGRRLSLGGLAILFIGMIASFVPNIWGPDDIVTNPIAAWFQGNWAWISFAALPLGFICASIGSYFINRFARRRWPGGKTIARPDELLERNMKGFDDKYTYFAWSLPANYVITGPFGIALFAVRSDKSKVTVQGERFREPFSIGRLFTIFAREGLGNPLVELADQERKLRTLLEGNGDGPLTTTDPAAEPPRIPIHKAAIFLNPEVQLTVDAPAIPVLRGEQLKEFIRRLTREERVEPNVARKLTEYLIQHNTGQEQTVKK